MSDEQIAQKLRGDTQFLGILIDRYEAKLGAYIRRKSSASADDIKDILQNVFIKVYKNIYDFDPGLTFSSWIYRITRNEMIDWYRREKRTPHLSLEGSEALLATIAEETDIAEYVAGEHFQKAFAKAVDTLPDKYRDVVILRFFEEKTYEEIADILTIPPGTVAIRISRAKILLQEKLKTYDQLT